MAELGFEPVPLSPKPTHHCMCCLSAYVFMPPNVNCLILRMWIVCSLMVSNSDKIYSCSEGILTLIDTKLRRFLSPYKFASNYKGPFFSLRQCYLLLKLIFDKMLGTAVYHCQSIRCVQLSPEVGAPVLWARPVWCW